MILLNFLGPFDGSKNTEYYWVYFYVAQNGIIYLGGSLPTSNFSEMP